MGHSHDPSSMSITAPVTRGGLDTAFETLADPYRRHVLVELERGAVGHEADLVKRAAEHTAEVALKHVHLPKLARTGYVEWNPDTGHVSKGPNFDEIRPVLELLGDHQHALPPGWP